MIFCYCADVILFIDYTVGSLKYLLTKNYNHAKIL
jgi:hypothetical protein